MEVMDKPKRRTRTTFKPYREYDFFDSGSFVANCPCCGQDSLRVTSVVLVYIRQKPFPISAKLEPDGFAFSDQIPDRYQDKSFDHSTENEKVECTNCQWKGGILLEGSQAHWAALKKCGNTFRDYLQHTDQDPDQICRRAMCPEATAGGDGYAGFCADCADKGYDRRAGD